MNREDAYFVDCGVVYDGVATTTISGLTHLLGETVTILADGEVIDDQVVSDTGTITLTTAASLVHVGLAFTSKLEPMKPVIETRMGSSAASIVACHDMGISFHNTSGVQYGTSDDELYDIDFDDVRWENTCEKDDLFTGVVRVSVNGGFSLDNPLIISTDEPLPCTVRALIPAVNVTGR